MLIEKLIRTAIGKLKTNYGLPSAGFIAGASLGNTIWEIVSGNKAAINDIDVFILVEKKEYKESNRVIKYYEEKEDKFYDDYSHTFITETNEYFSIISVEDDCIFNIINYRSNISDPSIILRSFDINSTRVGYSIDEDKVYYLKEFEEFINTGELKITALTTPAHTALRLIKKQSELNVKLDDFELKLCQYAIDKKLATNDGHVKLRFKDRYKKMYEKYDRRISKFFKLYRNERIEDYIKTNFGDNDNIYELISLESKIFEDNNLALIFDCNHFLFYMRKIYKNKELSDIFKNTHTFYVNEEYVDDEHIEIKDIELLNKIIMYSSKSVNTLKKYKLSEQIHIIKKIFNAFDDIETAVAVLENIIIDKDKDITEQDALILELAVRKKRPDKFTTDYIKRAITDNNGNNISKRCGNDDDDNYDEFFEFL